MAQLFEKINKLSLPAVILIASIVLGGFYFASQIAKQTSIENQQQTELRAKQQQQDDLEQKQAQERLDRMFCLDEATELATEQYKKDCTYNCKEGYFYIADKDNYLTTCLQRKGLK
jgi:hypothetical protein